MNPLVATFSLGFVVAAFALLPIEEKCGKAKHLQMVCGLNKVVYWLATYTWDLLWFIAFISLMLTLYLIFMDPNYTGREELPIFIVILLSYGLAVIPWVYMWSFVFTSPTTAYVLLFGVHFFSGFTFIVNEALRVALRIDLAHLLHYSLVWLPFPAYAMTRSMMYLSLDRPFYNKTATETYWDLLPFIISLLVQCCVYSSIVFLIEASPLLANML